MNSLLRHGFVCRREVVGLIVIALIVGGPAARNMRPGAGNGQRLREVMVAQVEQKDVDLYSEWIGTLAGEVNANVQAQVTGYLLRRNYQEGSFVRKGQSLFEIDPRPLFRAALDQAEGQFSSGHCAACERRSCSTPKTNSMWSGTLPWRRRQAASQQDLDNANQNYLAAKATVATDKAQIKTRRSRRRNGKAQSWFYENQFHPSTA